MDNITEEEKARICIRKIRRLLEDESNLICPKDEEFLIRFVRARKYNAEAAFRNLKLYYGIRLKHPDSFSCLYPSKLRRVLDSGVVNVLKFRDDMRRKIFVFRVGRWNPECFSFDDVTMTCMLVAEEMTYCQESQKAGAVVIVDHHGLSMSHAKQLTVAGFRKLLQMFQDCFPAKYKAIHLVNQPYLFDVFFSIAKKFMSNKIQRRMHFHAEYHSLQKFVSSSILAESLGGTLCEAEAWDTDLIQQIFKREKFYQVLYAAECTYSNLWNTKEISMDEVHLTCVLLLEEMSCIKEFQEKGVVMIHDYDGFEFCHFRQATVRNFIRILQIMKGNSPLKFKAFHEVNQPSLFYILYKIFYPLVSLKLRKRIFMHGIAREQLADHFPLCHLPRDLGGTSEAFSDETFMNSMFQRERYYEPLALSLNQNLKN